MSDTLVTAEEAASCLGMSARTINTWRGRGYLVPVGKRGRANLYRLSDVYRTERERDRKHRHDPTGMSEPVIRLELSEKEAASFACPDSDLTPFSDLELQG